MPAGGQGGHCRPRASANPLNRPEFMSLNQPRPPGGPPGGRGLKGHSHSHAHGPRGPPQGPGAMDDREAREVPDGEEAPPPAQDRMQLNPTFWNIAYSSLTAVDISLSRRMAVCVTPNATWGAVRYLVSMLSLSGHGVVWLCGTLICLSQTQSDAAQEVLINLLMALILDVMTVAGLQKLMKRRGPWLLPPGFLDYVVMDIYAFPAAHASRAVLVTKFLLNHLVLALPLRILLFLWACLVGVSRVMLGKHHLSDVAVGFALGFLHYVLVESFWLSGATCQSLMDMAAFSWSALS